MEPRDESDVEISAVHLVRAVESRWRGSKGLSEFRAGHSSIGDKYRRMLWNVKYWLCFDAERGGPDPLKHGWRPAVQGEPPGYWPTDAIPDATQPLMRAPAAPPAPPKPNPNTLLGKAEIARSKAPAPKQPRKEIQQNPIMAYAQFRQGEKQRAAEEKGKQKQSAPLPAPTSTPTPPSAAHPRADGKAGSAAKTKRKSIIDSDDDEERWLGEVDVAGAGEGERRGRGEEVWSDDEGPAQSAPHPARKKLAFTSAPPVLAPRTSFEKFREHQAKTEETAAPRHVPAKPTGGMWLSKQAPKPATKPADAQLLGKKEEKPRAKAPQGTLPASEYTKYFMSAVARNGGDDSDF